MPKKKPHMILAARYLRSNLTQAEKKLWSLLRNRQLGGRKFLRQYPLVFDHDEDKRMHFIVDFYCAEAKLIIELDGSIHENQREVDEARDQILSELGYFVLRFPNEHLNNIEDVLNQITKTIASRLK